ncbi:V8-like Glu-specific endopeptidase OS=Streptomyces griseomycini OX=66895 GN=FHS37_002459 PE=4 SV=1 [Streptomyces griseomycini]
MRSIRTSAPLGRGRRTVLAATGLVAALALTATACGGSEEDTASDKPDATASTGRRRQR